MTGISSLVENIYLYERTDRPEVMSCNFSFLFFQAVRRIQATPGFTEKASQAAAAYLKQRQLAATAVELVRRRYAVPDGQTLGWMHRPDVQQVVSVHLCVKQGACGSWCTP